MSTCWSGNGKAPGRDHLREVGGALEVGQLQTARGAHGQQVGVAGDDPEDPALAPHRDGLDPDRDLLAPLRVALAHDPALVEGRVQHRSAAARDEVADHVVLVRGRAGVGPHLGDRDVAGAVAGGDPQHQVGEGEVGEQLPLRDQQMQPLEVGVVEGGVLAYEVVHGGHVCERTRRVRPDPGRPLAQGRGMPVQPRRHPRAAAPGRDPQPSRHRSPEQHRPWGVRSRSAEGRSRSSQGREPRFLGPPSCAGKTEACSVSQSIVD